MRIQHNIAAMSAYRNYNNNTSALSKNLEKLSSGYKINRAGDDAAGLAISEKMRAQITGLEAASKNVKDGISLVKTAEGAMQEVQDMLNRMDYLATQSANGTYDNEVDRANLQKEVDALKTEINRIADSANFNGIKLLDGTQAEGVSVRGAKSVSVGLLPGNSTGAPGSGTILHRDAATGKTGTTFSVDLHNASFSTGSTASYKLTAGDVEIEFKGAATGDGSTVTADKLIAALTKGDTTNFTVTGVKVGGVAATLTNGVITTAKYGDINLTAGSKGDNRLTFTQAKRPTTDSEVWDVAKKVKIENTGSTGKIFQSLSAEPSAQAANQMTVTAATTKFDIVAGSAANKAITATVTAGTALADALVAASAASGAVTLQHNSGTWTFSVGGKSVTASAALSGSTVTFKSSDGTTLATLTLAVGSTVASQATMGAVETAFASAKTIGTLGTTSNNGSGAKPVMGSGVKNIQQAVTVLASAGYTAGTPTTAKATVAGVAAIDWTAKGSTSVSSPTLGSGFSITLGDITVKASAIDLTTASDMGDVRAAVIDALEAAAVADVKKQYAANASTITVYSDFQFVNASGAVVQAAGDAASIQYKVTTYSNNPDGGQTGAPSMGQDYNFTTTAIEKVGTDAGDRLAGTWLTKGQVSDYVADGKGLKVGNEQYVFTTNKDLALPEGTKSVYIGDLVDEKTGKVTDVDTALERLTQAAAGNKTYTVGYDKTTGRVGFEEIQGQSKNEDGWDLTTRDGIAKSLGFIEGSVTGNGGLTLQIGDTSDDFNQMKVVIGDMHTTGMGIDSVDVSTQEGAAEAVNVIKDAINYVSGIRGDLGAIQNRLEHTGNNLSVMRENIQDAESTIRDTDVAEEMMSYVKNNILVQSAQAMLAQANQLPQGVLQLLG